MNKRRVEKEEARGRALKPVEYSYRYIHNQ